jgi:signal transduction histidine kinase
MSLLEILQLTGYGTATALHFWMGALLVRQRRVLARMERVLLALAASVGVWHASNLALTLHALLGLSRERWSPLLRFTDSLAVIGVTLTYSLLLHVHLHLWAISHGRELTRFERARVYLSYIPALFLATALPRLWTGPYRTMLEAEGNLVLPFALWAAYVLCLVAVTDWLIARRAATSGERQFMRRLAASFVAVAVAILAVYALRIGEGRAVGEYLKTFANLGSLLPSALLAYRIYRYRFLELIIQESLVVALFAVVVLIAYLYGVRAVGELLTARYGLRPGVVESLLILVLAFVAAPLRGWLGKYIHRLFTREVTLYRDIVARIGEHRGDFKQLPSLLSFIEARTAQALGLRRVTIMVCRDDHGLPANGDGGQPADWTSAVLEAAQALNETCIEEHPALWVHGYELAYVLRCKDRVAGLMLVDAAPDALTPDARAMLEVLAGQVAVTIEDCRLVEENVQLERRLAQRERLASLGQMAATVAHEVKNPLSAIKSIAQVMREDERLRAEYGRDIDLIVGETDRLNRSVTQLLSFARAAPPSLGPSCVGEMVRTVIELAHAEAARRHILIDNRVETDLELSGEKMTALRDALSNLVLNAIQAAPVKGRVWIEVRTAKGGLLVSVADNGPGIPPELRERIWEPFFTTKQRGTGLGLAIVRKRMEEAGGTASLGAPRDGEGARFELWLPLD